MNLRKQLSIIAVLVFLIAVYLSQTYYSPRAIEARNVEFYQSLALEAREARAESWLELKGEFSGQPQTIKQALWADEYWLNQKDRQIMHDFNELELGAQARAKARQQIALGVVTQYIINLNRAMLASEMQEEELAKEIIGLERGLGPFKLDFGWQETDYFSAEEINGEASSLMNAYWLKRLGRLDEADSREGWRLEAIKLIELNSLFNIIETV